MCIYQIYEYIYIYIEYIKYIIIMIKENASIAHFRILPRTHYLINKNMKPNSADARSMIN